MAFNVQKINPLDLEPRKAIGVTLPFSSTSVFNQSYTTKDAIKSNLINLLLTNKGERVFNPTFGANLTRNLFENINQDRLDALKIQIQEEILNYIPTLEIKLFELLGTPSSNSILLTLKYSVRSTNIEDEINIDIEV